MVKLTIEFRATILVLLRLRQQNRAFGKTSVQRLCEKFVRGLSREVAFVEEVDHFLVLEQSLSVSTYVSDLNTRTLLVYTSEC